MAMTVGITKGVKSEMNVVPLIDVLLVLLVIFMVMVPYVSVGLPARAPMSEEGAARTKVETPAGTIVVRVAADGSLWINREAASWKGLTARLEEIFARRAEKVAFVQGEDGVKFAEVARAVSAMRSAGIEQVGLLGRQQTAWN